MDLQEQERMISDLELGIDRLRALYEQWFMGFEKLEPHVPRKQVERTMQALRKIRINNTALRFRFQQQVQRYNLLQTYWRRVARQIEEGTYRRDVMRARARAEQYRDQHKRPNEGEEEEPPTHEVNLDEFDDTNPGAPSPDLLFSQAEATTPEGVAIPPGLQGSPGQPSIEELLTDPRLGRPAPARRPPPEAPAHDAYRPVTNPLPASHRPQPPTASASLTDDRVQAIYRDYISARQRCNQSNHGLTFERVSQQIRSQETTLRQKHGKDVDFQVTVKDGKAILRAVRKK